jgi:hypothetical protein
MSCAADAVTIEAKATKTRKHRWKIKVSDEKKKRSECNAPLPLKDFPAEEQVA